MMCANQTSIKKQLNDILNYKVLSQLLRDRIMGLLLILDDPNKSEKELHFARILAEDLISNTRDFPNISNTNISTNKNHK